MSHKTVLALLLLVTIHDNVRADTITIGATKDNTLYGNAGNLSNGKGAGVFSGVTGSGGVRRGLIQFTVAGSIPAGSTVTGVQLTLQVTNTHAPSEVIELHRVLEAWGEGSSVAPAGGGGGGTAQPNDATWTHRLYPATTWTTVGGSFSPTVSASQTVGGFGAYVWGSTPGLVADVQSFLDTPASNNGWLLQCTDEVGIPTAKKFASREETNGLYRPKLTIVYTPPSPFTSFCFGDGTGTACPCGNSGTIGNGCATSTFAGGALLTASGIPGASLATDTLTLTATDVSGPGLFFQGTGNFSGGLGLAFGDGLLCSGGTIARLGVVFPVGSTAVYPGGTTPNPIHIGGANAAGDVRNYQCWYRDAVAFCTASNFNLTQSVSLTWQP